MDSERAKIIIKQRVRCENFLQKSKGGLYVCPFCGSGTGVGSGDPDGALKVYPETNTWTCFSCKGRGEKKSSGDVFDIYMQEYNVTFPEALKALAEEAGITENIEFDSTADKEFAGIKQTAVSFNRDNPQETGLLVNTVDYSDYYRQCQQNLIESKEAQAYLASRGLTWQVAVGMGVGFDPLADPANAPGAMGDEYRPHPVKRIIIPTTRSHYVGRRIDGEKEYAKTNNKGGKPGIFQSDILFCGAERVFVTEGAFDALSLIEVGYCAIALNSTSNAEMLLKLLENQPIKSTLILCLDSDDAGRRATETIKEGLRRLNISYTSADVNCGKKDPNEALSADREAFTKAVEKAVDQAGYKPDNTLSYIDNMMDGEIEKFGKTNSLTGFSNLDARAKGLYPGLYVMAAISSLGKTTLALQMADNLASEGHDVLFFSMEQSRLEMVSKSFARFTAQADMRNAVNALSIRQGYRPVQVIEAIKQYKSVIGDRLSIIEGNFNCDVGFIADYIRQYINHTGKKPVVFIDYLQILQPATDGKSRNSKKDDIDLAVIELKRLSREFDLTMVIISSLNRANYMTPFAFESLKESGGIEYTADVIWGLQLACLDETLFDKETGINAKRKRINEAKEENPRKIKFICLKNRYGISHYEVNFTYYPEYDLFTPAPDTTTAKPANRTR